MISYDDDEVEDEDECQGNNCSVDSLLLIEFKNPVVEVRLFPPKPEDADDQLTKLAGFWKDSTVEWSVALLLLLLMPLGKRDVS